MTVQKVISKDAISENNEEMDYNDWIAINMKNICEKGNIRVKYVSRKNRQPNKNETQKIINELEKLDLADANALSVTLTVKGENVCKAGGWIEYLKQQENQSSSLNRLDNNKTIPNTTIAINNPTTTPSRKITKGEVWTIVGVIVAIIGIMITLFIAYMEGLFNKTV
jgi:hypothetical protein